MSCEHCLRGDAQRKELSDKDIDTFFSKVFYISTLAITGGEPSLAPHKINTIIDCAKKYGVGIGNFYIATNAKVITNDFLLAVMRLYCYCDENELSSLNYSNDDYHDEITDENIKRLSVFSFAGPRYNTPPRQGEYELNEGRARENGIGSHDLDKVHFNDLESHIYLNAHNDDIHITQMDVYLNAKGNITSNCDLSYKNQDKKQNIICHVDDMTGQAFIDYVKKFIKE
jgi:hypothetical protein